MNAQIREACISDYEHLCTLFAEENQFHARLVPMYIQTAPHVLTQEELKEFLTSRTHCLFVCEDSHALMGAIIVSLKDDPEDRWKKRRHTGYIEDLIVTATAQGRGIGKQLMEAARGWVVAQGIQTIELHVWNANAGACNFYESLGLRSVQRRMTWEL
jgi:ribosomal protein S18 acetylase RimI-like enzyme